jgi:N-acetylneuraminic acid mutarotase
MRLGWSVLGVCALWGACSSDLGPGGLESQGDGGPNIPADSGVAPDGGPLDSGLPDGGVTDAGTPDGGPTDGGLPTQFTTVDWERRASQPFGVSEGQGVVIGGKLYTFGGFDVLATACCTPTRRAFVYDPASDRWTPIHDLPLGVTHAGFTTDGVDVFYAGGYIEDASRTFQIFGTKKAYRYRPALDVYEPLPNLPVERAAGQLEYLAGKLHYFGGQNLARTQDTGDHFVLDLANLSAGWTTAAPLPNPRNHVGSAVLDGRIYVVGGQHGHDQGLVTQQELDVWDPASDRWTRLADLPLARSHIAQATFAFQGRVIVLAGELRDGVSTDVNSAYDPLSNTWVDLTPLPAPRHSGVGRPIGEHLWYTSGDWSAETLEGIPR